MKPDCCSPETPHVLAHGDPLPAAPPVHHIVQKGRRGFAGMDRAKVAEIASKGGKAAHARGTAHKFDTAEARAAGLKGGNAPHVRRGRGPRKSEAAS